MGGDHGGGAHGAHDAHHHNAMPKIPDFKKYRTETVPELMAVRRALAAKGLKDPWLRNEVWKYEPKNLGSRKDIFKRTIFRGMFYGFIAAVITTGIGMAMDRGDHGHGHGHDEKKH